MWEPTLPLLHRLQQRRAARMPGCLVLTPPRGRRGRQASELARLPDRREGGREGRVLLASPRRSGARPGPRHGELALASAGRPSSSLKGIVPPETTSVSERTVEEAVAVAVTMTVVVAVAVAVAVAKTERGCTEPLPMVLELPGRLPGARPERPFDPRSKGAPSRPGPPAAGGLRFPPTRDSSRARRPQLSPAVPAPARGPDCL